MKYLICLILTMVIGKLLVSFYMHLQLEAKSTTLEYVYVKMSKLQANYGANNLQDRGSQNHFQEIKVLLFTAYRLQSINPPILKALYTMKRQPTGSENTEVSHLTYLRIGFYRDSQLLSLDLIIVRVTCFEHLIHLYTSAGLYCCCFSLPSTSEGCRRLLLSSSAGLYCCCFSLPSTSEGCRRLLLSSTDKCYAELRTGLNRCFSIMHEWKHWIEAVLQGINLPCLPLRLRVSASVFFYTTAE